MSPPRPRSAPAKHAVIVAHPNVESFTMSVARAYCEAVEANGQVATLRDLYRSGFDPVLKSADRTTGDGFVPAEDVAAELDQLAGASIFVLVYPVWFGAPPAMIKGYVERVFGAGFAEPLSGVHLRRPTHPLLGGRRLLSFTSSGSTRLWLEEQGAWTSLQTLFDGYLARTFWMQSPEHVHFESIVEGIDPALVRAHLRDVAGEADRICRAVARTRA